ncbi:diguanylate cyclase (GGDEF) domain-containing protein [Succiniclasticum ruminis]|uniref:Diguanylate cyclase (GGDEF) domain-containing protein n=1 Tax=Succiniclasticum ruminis TaxID=40841 RepID=A0A1G6LXC4_9FIRM|nr:GGDEF domain-containing protein [Succiniclasticum ruminis]SDC47871.1 diguanylate cyclase (GGDEF) domain-containing protein [Succiniclasticum ruminis]
MKSTQPQQIAVGAKSTGGIAANSLMWPIIVVLAILHIVIFALIVQINATSAKLSAVSRTAGERIEEATSVLAGASLLSETSTNFIMVPVHEHGEINVAPLAVFATELARPHRGNQVLERFRNYDVSPEALARLKDAAGNAEKLKDAQLHALALINSVYPFPNVYPVNQIPLPELNEAEKAMPAERRLAQSRIVALGSVASMNKRAVSQNVNACKDILRANVGAAAAEVGKKIVILRTVLLGLAGLVMLILIGTFVALYKQMIHPLQGFVQLITANQPLDEEKGLQEVRLVASAYNSLRKRRDALDAILRSAAETDALTNLPNRYRFEQYLLDVGERGYSLAILMFDINYLKETNDTEGHSAGDNLIRTAAQCITSCFGEKSFRIGGDEFAAVVEDCRPETVQQMIYRFREAEEQENISISVGYAYADNISETTIKQLLDEADKQMYAEKQAAHKRLRQYV